MVLFAILVPVATLRTALAAGGPSPEGAAAIEAARQSEAAGRVEDAVNQLERAYELDGDPELLFHLGELTSRLGQDVRALRLYRTYLTRDPDGKNHAAAELRIAALEGHAPPASDPAAAPPSPAPPPIPPPATASVAAPAASAPLVPTQPSPAADTLTVVSPPAADAPPIPRWAPWAGLAATVGLAIAATVSGLSASERYDALHNTCGATAAGCSQGQIDDVRSSANRTTVLWVGAGVLAAVTGAGFYVNAREAGVSGVWRF